MAKIVKTSEDIKLKRVTQRKRSRILLFSKRVSEVLNTAVIGKIEFQSAV